LTQLDHTPEVRYRRAWTMAEFAGRVYCSTLPSGKIYAYQSGVSAMYGEPLSFGWHHIAAVKSGDRLHLFVDSKRVATSDRFKAADFDLDVDQPLKIGFGQNDYLRGSLSDDRIYNRAISSAEVSRAAEAR
jgi:hypothetical protein